MATTATERKRVRLHARGGSWAVTLPKKWLKDVAVADEVELVRHGNKIIIEAPAPPETRLEDEPEFPLFLRFVSKWSLAHPEQLAHAVDVMDQDEDLFAGVDLDD